MSKLKSKKEINAKITAEKKSRKTLPEHSAFGDNNWERIDKSIVALEWVLDNYDVFDVEEKIDEEYGYWDESDPDFSDSDYEDMSNAVQPYQWAIGVVDDF